MSHAAVAGTGIESGRARKRRRILDGAPKDRRTFVEHMLHSVSDTLRSDAADGYNPASHIRRRMDVIANKVGPDATDRSTASRAVLEARFALGKDDSHYLAQAVSLLWAGDGGERLRIVPPTAMPEIMRHASANGIVRAMASVISNKREAATRRLRSALDLAGWLLQMVEVRRAVLHVLNMQTHDDLAKQIYEKYSSSDADGGAFVRGLGGRDDGPGREAAFLVLEALYSMVDSSSPPVEIVSRLEESVTTVVAKGAARPRRDTEDGGRDEEALGHDRGNRRYCFFRRRAPRRV